MNRIPQRSTFCSDVGQSPLPSPTLKDMFLYSFTQVGSYFAIVLLGLTRVGDPVRPMCTSSSESLLV